MLASLLYQDNGICPISKHSSSYSGLLIAYFDSSDSDEDAADCVKAEHHVIFARHSYAYAQQLFQYLVIESISTVEPTILKAGKIKETVSNLPLKVQPSLKLAKMQGQGLGLSLNPKP